MSMAVHAPPQATLPINPPRFRHSHLPELQLKSPVTNLYPSTRHSLHLNYSFHRPRVLAQATSGSDFNELAYRLTEEARKKATEAAKYVSEAAKSVAGAFRERVSEFQNDRDLKRRFREATEAANEKMGDFAYETRKTAQRWNRQYRITERVDETAGFFREQARRIDREFGIGQKGRALSMDFRRNWPTTLIFLWFALSGWLFRIIILGTWVLPFAAPFLIGAIARNSVIEVKYLKKGANFESTFYWGVLQLKDYYSFGS